MRVSLFVDPEPSQLEAAAHLGADIVELHTGAYCHAAPEARSAELERLAHAAEHAHALGLAVNAGHGLDYENTAAVAALAHLEELNIGHAIVARALTDGVQRAVADMRALCEPS